MIVDRCCDQAGSNGIQRDASIVQFTCRPAHAGDEKLSLHLDWYLCSQEHNTGATGSNSARFCEHIQISLELVYFLWFQQKHLTRGAKVLSKVQCKWSHTALRLKPSYK